ncbi:putative LSR2-like protein [Gordonia effusa NBRC 100432]|uniref:Putative LSR2-like protein n=1 Tax=Gordonia effusa NBRC 100432 TaxID=1077974 RepID=H0R6D9_9ACTN|nr:Lsr2 family protein [Gordonia effusa]GAB20640.1 putative LSR2-like protein [Gordonia effusa NBRC 100432]
MAKRTTVKYVDDLDGKALTDPVTIKFGLDGKQYEFDTSAAHAKQFQKHLDGYIAVSRRGGSTGVRHLSSAGTRSKEQTQAIRDWARKNGHEVSARGRIPAAVVEAFDAAH